MTQKLIAHYVVKVFIDDDLTETQMGDARCNFIGLEDEIRELFEDAAEYEVEIQVTKEG